jgi:hypothetical protein
VSPDAPPIDLRRQLLVAALALAYEDLGAEITFEQLLVEAWSRNPQAFGLRGFETKYPDSERLHRELDSRGKGQGGLVGQGLLEKVRPRVYRLTPQGMHLAAADADHGDPGVRERVDRRLEAEVTRLISSNAFRKWLRDPAEPRSFREAGQFWRVSPGTPPQVVEERLAAVTSVLKTARSALDRAGSDAALAGRGGGLLFTVEDLTRCEEFHAVLIERFADDLDVLGVRVGQ